MVRYACSARVLPVPTNKVNARRYAVLNLIACHVVLPALGPEHGQRAQVCCQLHAGRCRLHSVGAASGADVLGTLPCCAVLTSPAGAVQ